MKLVRWAFRALSLSLILCAAMLAPSLHAQQTLGSINGTVTDATGAAIPGAKITVVNNGTGLTRSTSSQGNGFFQILNLPIGTYKVTVDHAGFQTSSFPKITVRESLATTVSAALKVGSQATTIQVNANPLLNATDTTNGYTMDKAQIESTPLATGSFTQLAVLAPGVNAELLAGVGTNQGLGNQPIWANGQRDTSNTFTVDGVDVVNLFNGKSSSEDTSQRYQFNIGEGSSVGGQDVDSITTYGSNGNGLASPPPEFMNELQVTTSMYDASQGATSGAHVDVSTSTGSNAYHGEVYGIRGTNALNAVPFFYKQDVGLGTLSPQFLDPALHRWTAGGTLGGPIIKNKLFFFVGYQHLYDSDQVGALSQFQVPAGLTDDRSTTGIESALCSYYAASTATSSNQTGNQNCSTNGTQKISEGQWNSAAIALLQAKLPDGEYLIPSTQNDLNTGLANIYNKQPNVSLQSTSIFKGDQATASLDYNASQNDHVSAKYYYQHTPSLSPYGVSSTNGFPDSSDSGAQVVSLNNSVDFGSHVNWQQVIGFSRQKVYSSFKPQLAASDVGIAIPGGDNFPGIENVEFATSSSSHSITSKVGPYNYLWSIGSGYFENRIEPLTNVFFTLGKHTLAVGGDFEYDQLNIRNLGPGHAELETKTFPSFLEGKLYSGQVLEGYSNRHYRSDTAGAYIQDKYQVTSNIAITAGLRYDFDGPLREQNGLMFNFDPSLYEASPSAITNAGFIVAGNNKQYGTPGVSDSTLKGRQWGIAPRIGIAWSPKMFHNKVVWRAGYGIYYDRGEYFQYLSPPAGQGISGPFGVTDEAPFAAYTNSTGSLSNPFPAITQPTTPANIASTLPTIDQMESQCTAYNVYKGIDLSGYNCGAVPAIIGNYNINNVLPYTENWMLDFQWQPTNTTSVDLGYVANRGKHEVIPLPFNEPKIATPSNPINGQDYSYGVQTLSPTTNPATGVPYYNKYEPYDTFSGGNVDLRVPYIGYDPNSTSFETVGISSYDALQAQIQQRMSHGFSAGASYTWSHTLDEQSDIGLFFTGDNPDDLRSSYADADFDRTNVLTFNYDWNLPNAIKNNRSWLGKVINDWSLLGITTLQSGEPYSIYDYSGTVGNQYFGANVDELNPVLPIKPGLKPREVYTGHSGAYTTGSGSNPVYAPALNADDFYVPLLNPGENGAPPCDTTTDGGNAGPGGGPLCDVYETTFVPGQRNIFRQSFQRQANMVLQKQVTFRDRYHLLYQFEVFNVTNTPSFDVPTNNLSLGNYLELNGEEDGTQVQPTASSSVTTPSGTATCSGSSPNCAYELYTTPGTSSNKLGVVTNTIGSARIIEMALHLTF